MGHQPPRKARALREHQNWASSYAKAPLEERALIEACKVFAGPVVVEQEPPLIPAPEPPIFRKLSLTDLPVIAFTLAGTGILPTVQYIFPNANFTLTNGTAAQNVFSTPIDTIAVAANTTYAIEGVYIIQSGTTNHSTSISFIYSGGFNVPGMTFSVLAWSTAALTTPTRAQDTLVFQSTAGGAVNIANALAFTVIELKGCLRVTDAGTIVPKLTFSAAPGGTNQTLTGSYLRFYPIGKDTDSKSGTSIS